MSATPSGAPVPGSAPRAVPERGTLRERVRSWWEHRVLFEPKDWIQIEVTTRCNARCAYCPRTVHRRGWLDRSLPLELFRSLVPALRKCSLAYLQGWGEPFLHPELPAMVRLAKEAGCRVGTTTNGMALTPSRLQEVVEAGLDLLAFSLAGTTPAYNDRVRAGTRLSAVLEGMALARRTREERGGAGPAIHVAYLLLRSGLDELPALPRLLAGHGAQEAVVSLLDFEAGPGWEEELLPATAPGEREEVEGVFREVEEEGRKLGVAIHTPRSGSRAEASSGLPSRGEASSGLFSRRAASSGPSGSPRDDPSPVCPENPLGALFVSSDGEVAPCVFAALPMSGESFARRGVTAAYRRRTFGNLRDELLPVLWRSPGYAAFREGLSRGDPPELCRECPKRLR